VNIVFYFILERFFFILFVKRCPRNVVSSISGDYFLENFKKHPKKRHCELTPKSPQTRRLRAGSRKDG